MRMKSIIPLRPDGWVQNSLSQDEQSALTWYHLSGCSRKDAFVTFARPDMLTSKAKAVIDEYIKQFFSRKDVREYLDAYKETLDNFLHPKVVKVAPTGTLEERKALAKKKAMEFAMSLADNIAEAEDPETVLKLMDKVGLLDGDEQVVEEPRRYLPISCGLCEYRKFVEENCERVDDGTKVEEEQEYKQEVNNGD